MVVVGGLVWLQWFLPRYREKRFLARLHAAEAKAPGEGAAESDRLLQEKMLEASRILRSSPEIRRSGGLPLYALPWFVLIGATQSGKTTLLRSVANVFSPFARPATTSEGPTQDCDWWFFNTAIILDTGGSYAFPVQGTRDETQWYRFLQLLRHYRELQPINGVLIAVGADSLATKGQEELRVDAAELRKRLDETIRELGVDFPVYVLITRCDLIEGFSEFFGRLSESALERVFGYVKDTASPAGEQSALGIEAIFTSILERLHQLRLSLLGGNLPAATLRQKLFCFPEEFRALQRPLSTFVETLFAENPFQHRPTFRGIFCCSAQQQGAPLSFLRRELHFDGQGPPVERGAKGYFLHDLFSVILPRDRYLARSTVKATAARRMRHLLGFAACLVLCALLGFLLTRASLTDRQILAATDETPCRFATVRGSPATLLSGAEACHQVVQQLIDQNRQRPAWNRLLFNRSGRLEDQLRQRYVETFEADILTPLDTVIGQQLHADAETIPLVFLLIKRIELINRCLSSSGCADASDKDLQPDYQLMLDPGQARPPTPSQLTQLQSTYEAYLRWSLTSEDVLQRELAMHAERLRHWFSAKQFAPRQVLQWASQHYPPVSLQHFWENPPGSESRPRVQVDGGYTASAWKQSIQPFLQRAGDAVPDMEPLLQTFRVEYRGQYFEQWQRFLADFPQGELPWSRSREQRRLLAFRLMDDSSPYNRILDLTFDQLKPFLPMMLRYESAPSEVAERVPHGILMRLILRPWQWLSQFWARGGNDVERVTTSVLDEFMEQPIPDWVRVLHQYLRSNSRKAYLEALKQVGDQLGDNGSLEKSFQLAQSGFQEGKPTDKSTNPILKAWWIAGQFREQQGVNDSLTEKTFWPLLERPLHLTWKVVLEGAGDFLQRSWGENVLAPTRGLSKLEQLNYLYGPQGKARAFGKQFVSPFLVDNDSRPGRLFGEEMPVPPAILSGLQEAKQLAPILELKTSHRVRVEATRESLIDSFTSLAEERTELVVECATKAFKVSTRSRDISEGSTTVFWSPEECGDVIIAVSLACGQTCLDRATALGLSVPQASGIRIIKRYSGQVGFLHFIQDFRNGSRVFGLQDFSGAAEAWRRYHINSIRVFYRVETPDTLAKLISLIIK
jgi:type VI secretion system protein ImpL